MARTRRWLLWVVGGLVVLAGAFVLFMRAGRGRCDAPTLVRDKVWREHTAVSDVYGARIGDSVILFDTGADPEGRPVDKLLAQLGRGRDDVSDVFITHGHFDHIAGANVCRRARLHGGIGDSDMMSRRGPVVPGMARFMGRLMPVPRVMLTDAFIDKASVSVGSDTIRAIPFPGHTPGSMFYLYDGVLFVGDSINISGGKLVDSPHVFSVDAAAIKTGIANLASSIDLTEVKSVCTGHGGCTPEADTQRLLADYIKQAQS